MAGWAVWRGEVGVDGRWVGVGGGRLVWEEGVDCAAEAFVFWQLSMVNRDLYDQERMFQCKADILRLEILWHEGGIYVDADMVPSPLSVLIASTLARFRTGSHVFRAR